MLTYDGIEVFTEDGELFFRGDADEFLAMMMYDDELESILAELFDSREEEVEWENSESGDIFTIYVVDIEEEEE